MTTSLQAQAPGRHVSAPSTDRHSSASMPSRVLSLLYGSLTYVLFLGTFLYVIGFLTGLFVPKHINSGEASSFTEVLLVNGGFLALFAVQHTIMARRAFKQRWTKIIPQQVERSTFVLVTCAILIGMMWNWQPLPGGVWEVTGPLAAVLWSVCALGWGLVLYSTFLIDHFELFGLRQVVLHALGRPYEAPKFVERSVYRHVRHPLMLGFLLAFWSTPAMSYGQLFFAVMVTAYVLVGLQIEERTLIAAHGESYRDYRRRVPMLLPFPRRAG